MGWRDKLGASKENAPDTYKEPEMVNHLIRQPIIELTGKSSADLKFYTEVRSHNDLIAAVKKKRKELKIEQIELAQLIGIGQAQYSRLENGGSLFNIEQLVKICARLNIGISIF